MLLKRLYDHSSDKPKLSGVRVLRAKKHQHFSQHLIDGGIDEGWLSLGGGKISIKSEDGDVSYIIARSPGIYCCHCDEKLGGLNEGATAEGSKRMLEHVKTHGGASPDPSNPAGYRQDNFYTGVLQGDDVENMTREEAVDLDQQVRAALYDRLQKRQDQAKPDKKAQSRKGGSKRG